MIAIHRHDKMLQDSQEATDRARRESQMNDRRLKDLERSNQALARQVRPLDRQSKPKEDAT